VYQCSLLHVLGKDSINALMVTEKSINLSSRSYFVFILLSLFKVLHSSVYKKTAAGIIPTAVIVYGVRMR
jgi:hypothetical protein